MKEIIGDLIELFAFAVIVIMFIGGQGINIFEFVVIFFLFKISSKMKRVI